MVWREWRLKLALTLVFTVVFWTGYGFLGSRAFFPLRTVPLTWLDTAIQFQPTLWGWIYLSQFAFTSVIPWLISTKADLVRYATGLALLIGVSFLCFLFFPVAAPRPEAIGNDLAMRLIVGYDGVLNCFPSLHAGFLCYTAALTWRLFGRNLPLWSVLTVILWGTAVLISTLTTKQHYLLDLVAGGALGFVADAVAWRRSAIADATRVVSVGTKSQAGER